MILLDEDGTLSAACGHTAGGARRMSGGRRGAGARLWRVPVGASPRERVSVGVCAYKAMER